MTALMICAALAVVVWIRMLPLSLAGVAPAERAQLTYTGADKREHVYLGDYDSYYWLRAAREYLRHGTVCDRVIDGECHDDYTRAPVGSRVNYEQSLHILSIAWLHRLLARVVPGFPLPASAFLVPVLIGALGVIPAFAIGQRLAGRIGGMCAALVVGVNPVFLTRSMGSDNDVWNVVLPLVLVWAAIAATGARSQRYAVGFAVAGVMVAGLHALTWRGWRFSYAVVLLGLLAHLAAMLLRGAIRREQPARWSGAIRRAAVALACFWTVPLVWGVSTGMSLADSLALLRPASESFQSASSRSAVEWPAGFATVGELRRPDLRGIADTMAGVPAFFVGWLGLLLLLLPRRQWQWWHFALLIVGNYLYAFLVTRPNPGRPLLIALLALPLAAAMLLSVCEERSRTAEPPEQAAALLVVVWFVSALFLAFEALRFALLLVAPFGIVFGVAVGRACEWLTSVIADAPAPRVWVRRLLPILLTCVALYLPLRAAYGTASAYIPSINDAWWDTLTRISAATPPETIVTTWWPYGYWAEYAADRRSTTDGGSLTTHVPYWLGRALLTSTEEETLGLLRMLDCGSEPAPTTERDRGAFGRIVRQGVDEMSAQAMVLELARRARGDAAAYLNSRGIPEPAQQEILAVTHCAAPPALLILSSDMVGMPGWKYLGNWSFRNAYVADHLAARAETDAVRDIVQRFGATEDEARILHGRATHLDSAAARAEFVSPHEFFLTTTWAPCQAQPGTADLICPLNVRLQPSGAILDAFVYQRATPSLGRFRWHRTSQATRSEGTLAIIAAGLDHMESFPAIDPIDARLAALVDLPNDRVLVGTPALLRSTFTHLMFLDGRYSRHFAKFDERHGYGGERVVTWRVDWEGPHQ